MGTVKIFAKGTREKRKIRCSFEKKISKNSANSAKSLISAIGGNLSKKILEYK
jgi:hypothetical protein